MKITLESTPTIVTLDGVPARVWTGHSGAGVPIIALITRVGVEVGSDASEFEAELREIPAPTTPHSILL